MPKSHCQECSPECKNFEIRTHSSLKGQIIFFFQLGMVLFQWKYENRKKTTQFYLVFRTNEQEWTELSKKIVRLCRNHHDWCKTKAN